MYDIIEKNFSINIEDELKRSYIDYAMSVIISRALPDARDGLKPVHRRILYAMYILNNCWNKPYKKSARIVGDVIGKYHPHGDNSVYDSIVRMAQVFSLRYVLIDGQGNFGSIDGDSAAAMRYTEIRMSKIANELLFDLNKNTVDFEFNYDCSEIIPSILPSRIPNLIINGSYGIAVGMTTNIPPHNLTEIVNACLFLIDNKYINVNRLMDFVFGPDFPTGGKIIGLQGIIDAYTTGKGKICIRSKCNIKVNKKTGNHMIIISEVPYQINKFNLVKKIFFLIKNKQIYGIYNIHDESDKDGICIIIEIKKNFSIEIVLKKLFLLTQMQIYYYVNMVALYRNEPKTFCLNNILLVFINHRSEIIIRRTIFELKKNINKISILEGLLIALLNIKFIVFLIQNSFSFLSIKIYLLSICFSFKDILFNIICKKCRNLRLNQFNLNLGIYGNYYYFSITQIKFILNLRLHKITNFEFVKIINEYKILSSNIFFLNLILKKKKYLLNIIRDELIQIKKNYFDLRCTKIVLRKEKIKNLIYNKKILIIISFYGYLKYKLINNFNINCFKKKNFIINNYNNNSKFFILSVFSFDVILLFSNLGRLYWIKICKNFNFNFNLKINLFNNNILILSKNERIISVLSINKYKNFKKIFILMITNNGFIKKTSLIKFNCYRRSGIVVIKLNKGDELINVIFVLNNYDIVFFFSKGKVLRFLENKIVNLNRYFLGILKIKLNKTDKIISLILVTSLKYIFILTKYGYIKRILINKCFFKKNFLKFNFFIKLLKKNDEIITVIQIYNFYNIFIITKINLFFYIKFLSIKFNKIIKNIKLNNFIKNEIIVGMLYLF